ncbi:hypothetical protein DFH11DRAFT_1880532, partial [Phellopilus nigrolimitatus]
MSLLGTPSGLSCIDRVYNTSPENSIDSELLSRPREHEYFDFKDGNVTFLVENTLFTVHQYFLTRESPIMRSMFVRAHLPGTVEGAKENPIELGDTNSLEFETFMKILYPPKFGEDSLTSSYEWESALRIANKYKFANIRKLAILKLLDDASCFQRLLLGRRYKIRLLVLSGFRDICNRDASLSPQEVRFIDAEDTSLIMQCRESLLKSSQRSMDDRATE